MSTTMNRATPNLAPRSRYRPATYSSANGPIFESLDDVYTALRQEIDAGTSSLVPECTTFDLSLGLDAIIPLIRPSVGTYAEGEPNDLPDCFKHNIGPMSVGKTPKNTADTVPHVTVRSMLFDGDAAQRSIAQRAASRGLLSGIQHVDGFKYSFNNAWAAKDHDGHRFSYICQDSLQNKDRHANGYNKTQKNVKGTGDTRGPRKETYDCKGLISIKFSSIKQQVEIQYRHYAIHDTVADRQLLAMIQPISPRQPPQEQMAPLPATAAAAAAAPAHSVKRKYQEVAQEDYAQPMSLADLLRQSSRNGYVSPRTPADQRRSNTTQTAVTYDMPSWQAPVMRTAPTPPQPSATESHPGRVHSTANHSSESSAPSAPDLKTPPQTSQVMGMAPTPIAGGPRFINHSSNHPKGGLYRGP